MKYQVHLGKTEHRFKPTNGGQASNDALSSKVELTPEEIAAELTKGRTIIPAVMKGSKRASAEMLHQQVMMLDFDNKDDDTYTSIREILRHPFVKENASFLYKSFNHSFEVEKFRLVFFLDDKIIDPNKVTEAYKMLFDHFPTADISCKDAARFFYGGKEEPIEINYSNVLELDNYYYTPETTQLTGVEQAEAELQEACTHMAHNFFPEGLKPNQDDSLIPTWQLIQMGEKDRVKERLSVYKCTVHSLPQAKRVLKTIDMRDILGEHRKSFSNFFHEDKNPSATILQMKDSPIWLYHCASGGKHHFNGDVIRVVQHLLGTYEEPVSQYKALNYLIDVTGMEIVMTEEISYIRAQCDLLIDLLLSEDLKDTYPNIHNQFWRYKTDAVALLNIFKENFYEDDEGNIRCLSWYSQETLAQKLYGSATKKSKVGRLLNLMCLADLLTKLPDSAIPERLLKKLKQSQKEGKRANRSNVFELTLLNEDFDSVLEEVCSYLREIGFTMKGFTREWVERTLGKDRADYYFPQHTKEKISKKAQTLATSIHKITLDLIDKQGYAHQDQILKRLNQAWKGKAYKETKLKECLAEMLEMYDLKRVQLNKERKKHLGLDENTKGSPKVIVPDTFAV